MNIVKHLFNWLTGQCFNLYMGGGGGGGQANTTYSNTSNIPEYAQPYVEQMLGSAQKEIFNYDAKGNPTNIKPYKPFSTDPNAYVAGFSPMQRQAMGTVQNMQVAPQEQAASNMAAYAGAGAMNTNYQPGKFFAGQVQAPNLQNYQMQGPGNIYVGKYDAPMMDTAQTGYNPQLQTYQMQGPQSIRSQQFNQNAAQQYMNPYMQSVVDVQQAAAQRQADIARTQRGAQAVGAGAFGGSRQAIVEAEANRALADQKAAIQAQGLQGAYSQAQQQFNADQAQRMQAALANQQAGLTVGQQNLGAALGVQQLGAQTGLQTSLANLSAAQQANVQNQAAQLQTQGMNAQQAMQAALANQQTGLAVGQQNLQSLLGVQQLGAGQNLQAQLANQQANQAAQQAYEQSRQYGAGLGMQGYQTGLQAAGQLGQLGQNIYGQQTGIAQLQNQYGAQQQALEQSKINQQIQDYATAQQYPMMQLANMSALTRGMPMQNTSTSVYQAAPSIGSQLAGLGTAAYGLSQLGAPAAKAKGGRIKEKRPAGLNELALMKMQ